MHYFYRVCKGQSPKGDYMKKETKDIKLSIRVTKTEKEILQQKADALGITLSKFMLNCALGRESHERN